MKVGADSSAWVPVVTGVAVSQGQRERPLCPSAEAWYERERESTGDGAEYSSVIGHGAESSAPQPQSQVLIGM